MIAIQGAREPVIPRLHIAIMLLNGLTNLPIVFPLDFVPFANSFRERENSLMSGIFFLGSPVALRESLNFFWKLISLRLRMHFLTFRFIKNKLEIF
jgi:hypothetical protein